MTAADPHPNRVGPWTAGVAVLVLALIGALYNLRDPFLPAPGLDASWILAAEYATGHGFAFGRDYISTYGPYHVLVTRLFDESSFRLVLAYDVFLIAAVFWHALVRRSLLAAAALLACLLLAQTQSDSLVAVAFLAIFLMCLERRGPVSLAFVALCAPLLLSKLSFAVALAPLMVLADAYHLRRGRTPLFTATLIASVMAAFVVAGQSPADLAPFLRATLEIVLGYGRAMQLAGDRLELVATMALLGLTVLVAAFFAFRAVQRGQPERADPLMGLAVVAGFAWTAFVLFKMGFVRHDTHSVFVHQAAPASLAVLYSFYSRSGEDRSGSARVFAVSFALVLAVSFGWRVHALRPEPQTPFSLARAADEARRQLAPERWRNSLGWATGSRWAAMAAANWEADRRLARAFPPQVAGAVDVVPWELSSVVASGLNYRPRPLVQSYIAYTPWLQAQDRAFFQGSRAPDTLLFKVQDIDGRLPTLALGPSAPIIAQRYDVVGADPLGLILRRRAAPRPMQTVPRGSAPLPYDRWIEVPRAGGRLMMARVSIRRSLAGRLAGFLYREPLMSIHLRTRSGQTVTYRFVPGMAELGVAISPLPAEQGPATAAVLFDPAWEMLADPVVAMQISPGRAGWAFAPGRVAFEEVRLAPGFAAGMGPTTQLIARLLASDPTRTARFDGTELFAHAPTRLQVALSAPARLKGVVGLHPIPASAGVGDGVRFVISAADGAGGRSVLFDRVLPRNGGAAVGPVPFEVTAPAGATLVMETLPLGDTLYDWSYWRDLEYLR